jgi:hypothetical protein
LAVVLALAGTIAQHQFGEGQLVKNALALVGPIARLKGADFAQRGLSGRKNSGPIAFELIQPQQLVMIERSNGRCHAQPFGVSVRWLWHGVTH